MVVAATVAAMMVAVAAVAATAAKDFITTEQQKPYALKSSSSPRISPKPLLGSSSGSTVSLMLTTFFAAKDLSVLSTGLHDHDVSVGTLINEEFCS